jgi:hypothetical protein
MSSRPASRRLAILSPDEIEALYNRPEFNDEERTTYFQLTPPEKTVLAELGTTSSKIHFILQLGYFKARHRFFVFDIDEVLVDAHYVQKSIFIDYLAGDSHQQGHAPQTAADHRPIDWLSRL